ncbi:T9SS type A sorting domain-containing protein [Ignavibacterium sp.]|uniref:T9SS type A sorting domain-containing protein n=1 Tax=Ignavibacterium sp. TaxID=2651167 RepID=UPI0021FEFAF7|nr:T9SS type A sorting domain-containing protein [Ignavibacterium sp.]BDQ02963.1 MAG: hypothetical protein KatS3mg037_1538 [Ignavibacterium sp.]
MRFSYLFTISIFISLKIFAQDISFIPRETSVNDTIGDEVVIYIDLTNISQAEQTVFVVRTINQMPNGWSTSLCFDYCYPDWMDSIATTQTYGSSPLQPGESREVSVHFFTNNAPNTGMVQLQAGTFRNPDQRITVELQASTFDPTSVEDEVNSITNFNLEQNYPNPFNPATKIRWQSPISGWQTLKVYDLLGNEISTLVNEEKPAGNHELIFNASDLPSGIYFYRLTVGAFSQSKAMILEK